MFSKLENLFQFVDKTVASISTEYSEEVKCKPGCADCCHAVFDVSFIEAAYLAAYLKNNLSIISQQKEQAQAAAAAFEKLVVKESDFSVSRIRCPLLSEKNLCLAHPARPINCRTYGTPTKIGKQGHVCGFSGFTQTDSYPTIDLLPLQQSLQDYSATLAGEGFKDKRFPIAWVLLRLEYFLPR